MKRFLSKILVFFLPLPLIWLAAVFVYGTFVPPDLQKNIRYASAGGYGFSRFAEADTTKNVDMLVLGSSHAYRGFDPRIFAEHQIRMFNLGSSSQRALQTKYLLNKYIDDFSPKLVIYEVSAMNLMGDGLESALDLCYSVEEPDKELFSMIMEVGQVKGYNTFLFAMLKSLGEKTKKKEQRMHGDRYIRGGYVETREVIKDKRELHTPGNAEKLELQESKHVPAFEESLKALKESNIPVILVQAPVSEAEYKNVSNQDELDRYFSSFDGVPYYNFNKILSLEDSCFIDPHHLNQRGVEEFNRALIARVPIAQFVN